MDTVNNQYFNFGNVSALYKSPNIFNYATSELSQDAVLCYFLSAFNYPRHELHDFSRSLLGFILRQGKKHVGVGFAEATIDYESVEIRRQEKNTDILVILRHNGGSFEYLVVEDKTRTSHHDHQLERYKREFEHQGKLHCVYYKTGYWFTEDYDVQKLGYLPIGKQEMLEIMKPYVKVVKSDIFSHYYEHLTILFEAESELRNYISGVLTTGKADERKLYEALSIDVGQDMLFSSAPYRRDRGMNPDGSPWLLLNVFLHPDEAQTDPGIPNDGLFYDYVFWRIDSRTKGMYIALRQYNKKDFTQDKIGRRDILRRCFIDSYEKVKSERRDRIIEEDFPVFEIRNNRGKFESEVACYYIQDGSKLAMFIELLSSITAEFKKEVRREFKTFYQHI